MPQFVHCVCLSCVSSALFTNMAHSLWSWASLVFAHSLFLINRPQFQKAIEPLKSISMPQDRKTALIIRVPRRFWGRWQAQILMVPSAKEVTKLRTLWHNNSKRTCTTWIIWSILYTYVHTMCKISNCCVGVIAQLGGVITCS